MERLNKLIDLVSKSLLSVLFVGETGVGKEVAAERLHKSSTRSQGPLVKLNCAALPEQLLENELFGHERGAFTGADTAKRGLVEAADGGTLFLDEIGELPLSTQAKLLRTLESREVLRLGALTPRQVDVRFVAATNRNLDALVHAGKFRSDLYFRLNGITLQIPPLRERRAELPEYVGIFIADACKRLDRPPVKITNEAIRAIENYSWPGNLRELRNVIERAVVLSGGEKLEAEHIMLDADSIPPPSQRAPLEGDERKRIQEALEQTGGNQTAAAKLLGIARRTLVYKLGLLDLPRPRKKDG
jgi:DNA-binding NtrC family response regulator